MNLYPDAVEEFMQMLKQLPGVGRRGAERLTLALLEWPAEEREAFALAAAKLNGSITLCPLCGALAENGKQCPVCSDTRRDVSLLCVVETMSQLAAVEKGGSYRGRYLVLGGRLSPLDGENGEHLQLELLRERALSGEVKEVILALSSDVEGRATAAYLTEMLQRCPVTVSTPALGLPAGANLSFADSATITAAFSNRKPASQIPPRETR